MIVLCRVVLCCVVLCCAVLRCGVFHCGVCSCIFVYECTIGHVVQFGLTSTEARRQRNLLHWFKEIIDSSCDL